MTDQILQSRPLQGNCIIYRVTLQRKTRVTCHQNYPGGSLRKVSWWRPRDSWSPINWSHFCGRAPDTAASYIHSASCSHRERNRIQQREEPLHSHSHLAAQWWISQCNFNCCYPPPSFVAWVQLNSLGSKAHVMSTTALTPPLTCSPRNVFSCSLEESGKRGEQICLNLSWPL